MVRINGKNMDVGRISIARYLEQANYDSRTVVVERNLEIVPKTEYENVMLEENDEIEIVSFMGGGTYEQR